MLRKLPILCALMACVCFQALVSASPNDDGQPAKKRAGTEARKRDPRAAQGARQKQAKAKAGAAGKQGGDRDPAKMDSVMMQKFDKDGDKKLNVEELTAMMTSMQERRAQQGGKAGKGNRPDLKSGKNADGKSANDNEAGGVKPQQPPAK